MRKTGFTTTCVNLLCVKPLYCIAWK